MYTNVVLTENYLAGTTISRIISYIRYKKGLVSKFVYGFRYIVGNYIGRHIIIGNKSRMQRLSELLQELQYDALNSNDERFATRCYDLIHSILYDLKRNCTEFNVDCNKVVYETESFLQETKEQQRQIKEKVEPSILQKLKSKLNVPVLLGLTSLALVGFKMLFNYLDIGNINLIKAPFVGINILRSNNYHISIKIIVGILLVLLLMGIYFLFKKVYQSIKSMISEK